MGIISYSVKEENHAIHYCLPLYSTNESVSCLIEVCHNYSLIINFDPM